MTVLCRALPLSVGVSGAGGGNWPQREGILHRGQKSRGEASSAPGSKPLSRYSLALPPTGFPQQAPPGTGSSPDERLPFACNRCTIRRWRWRRRRREGARAWQGPRTGPGQRIAKRLSGLRCAGGAILWPIRPSVPGGGLRAGSPPRSVRDAVDVQSVHGTGTAWLPDARGVSAARATRTAGTATGASTTPALALPASEELREGGLTAGTAVLFLLQQGAYGTPAQMQQAMYGSMASQIYAGSQVSDSGGGKSSKALSGGDGWL